MSLDVEADLHQILRMKDKDFAASFVVDEIDENIVIAIVEDNKGRPVWLSHEVWVSVNNYTRDKGGSWDKQRSSWTMPLTSIKPKEKAIPIDEMIPEKPKQQGMDSQATYKESGNEIPAEPSSEDESAFLKPTYDSLGPILPIFRTPSGEVIDGKHRLELDPGWWGISIRKINDPVKLAMARLVVNVVRRRVPAEEKTELLSQIAKLTGWSPQQIADSLGMSYQWVMRYLPNEYKIAPEKGKRAEIPEFTNVKVLQRRELSTTSVTPGFEQEQILRAIDLAPSEIQPKLKEVAVKQKLTPDETTALVSVIQETPEEQWPEVLLTPRKAISETKVKQPKKAEAKPEPLLTAMQMKCEECGQPLVLHHIEYPDGTTTHKIMHVDELD